MTRAVKTRSAAIRRGEDGFSLIEVMLVASILSVVLGAIFSLSDTTAKLAPNDDERAQVMDEARTGLYRVTRELRQATSAPTVSTGGDQISFNVGSTTVIIACTTAQPGATGRTRCVRTSGSASEPVIDHVVNGATSTRIFTLNSEGNYVAIRLRVAAAGARLEGHRHLITLDDGAYIRNVQ